MAEHPGENRWVAIARVVGPRGNRGEVAATSLSDNPHRFKDVSAVYVFDTAKADAEVRELTLEKVWEHRGRIVLKFRGIDTISEAERLRGCELRVPLASRPDLPAGEFYQSDLVGCDVVERLSGRRLGRVAGLLESAGPMILEVEAVDGEEVLIPLARSICVEIDPRGGRILVDLPGGLEDLNRR